MLDVYETQPEMTTLIYDVFQKQSGLKGTRSLRGYLQLRPLPMPFQWYPATAPGIAQDHPAAGGQYSDLLGYRKAFNWRSIKKHKKINEFGENEE